MAIPQNKSELIEAIETSYKKLSDDLTRVPANLVSEKCIDGHVKNTKITPCNLVSYLIGWNQLVKKWIELKVAGEPIDFPETGFKWNELGKLAEKFYQDYDRLEYQQLLQMLGTTKSELLEYIKSQNNKALYGQNWYKKYTLGRMIQFNSSSPYKNARGRVRKFLKTL